MMKINTFLMEKSLMDGLPREWQKNLMNLKSSPDFVVVQRTSPANEFGFVRNANFFQINLRATGDNLRPSHTQMVG
jgi:hypothetical protein